MAALKRSDHVAQKLLAVVVRTSGAGSVQSMPPWLKQSLLALFRAYQAKSIPSATSALQSHSGGSRDCSLKEGEQVCWEAFLFHPPQAHLTIEVCMAGFEALQHSIRALEHVNVIEKLKTAHRGAMALRYLGRSCIGPHAGARYAPCRVMVKFAAVTLASALSELGCLKQRTWMSIVDTIVVVVLSEWMARDALCRRTRLRPTASADCQSIDLALIQHVTTFSKSFTAQRPSKWLLRTLDLLGRLSAGASVPHPDVLARHVQLVSKRSVLELQHISTVLFSPIPALVQAGLVAAEHMRPPNTNEATSVRGVANIVNAVNSFMGTRS